MRKKADLPSKICARCGRPMVWRKRWVRVWDEVKYCSDRCRHASTSGADPGREVASTAQGRRKRRT